MSTTPNAVGDGRYALEDLVSARAGGGLWRAHDTRLDRDVLIQRDDQRWHGPSAHGLAAAHCAALAPVLDADDASRTSDVYAVYPDSDWPTLDVALAARDDLIGPDLAGPIAEWLLVASDALRSTVGRTVALDPSSVLIDPRGGGVDLSDACPVQWMPAPGARRDHLREVVGLLTERMPRRGRRRWRAEVGHRLSSHRRPSGRRHPTGPGPVITRTEKPCVSAEACS